MIQSLIFDVFSHKKGDIEVKHLVYWILIAACAIVIWFIVNGIIKKSLILY